MLILTGGRVVDVAAGKSFPADVAIESLAAGLSPQEAIRCATLGAAEKLGRPELGEVAPGKAADLVVVAGDPLEDMGVLRRIELVVAAGVPHRPEEFFGKGGEQDGT